jgi:small subunit ribosomal protein S17
MPRRILSGVVTSKSGNKSIVVQVDRRVRHPLYKKFMKKSKKYHAHDEENQFGVGDKVRIQECAPISKQKTWVTIAEGGA